MPAFRKRARGNHQARMCKAELSQLRKSEQTLAGNSAQGLALNSSRDPSSDSLYQLQFSCPESSHVKNLDRPADHDSLKKHKVEKVYE